ncbi:hypothetical protein V3565_04050 [Bartonella sp. B10]
MCLFSIYSKNAKIKKHIAQLKNELIPINHLYSNDNIFDHIFSMLTTWKKKSHQALYHLNEHATQLKKIVKKNPKTALTIAVAGTALACFLLIRKKHAKS